MQAIKICKFGKSLAMVLPKEVIARLKIQEGDMVYLTEAQEGGFHLTPSSERFAQQMAEAEDLMREDRSILRELAQR